MPMELDKDGCYIFNGKIAIAGGEVGDDCTVTLRGYDDGWQPVGYIRDDRYSTLEARVEHLEKLVKVLANALGVNEEFLASVT
jgi:hypothetical protein